MEKYLNTDGVKYLWKKITEKFALKTHTHDISKLEGKPTVYWDDIKNVPSNYKYTLPAATTSSLGGIKVGTTGLKIDSDGTLNAETATKTKAGVVKIGDGLTITNGVLKSNIQMVAATTTTLGGVKVGSGLSVNEGTVSVKVGSGLSIVNGKLVASSSGSGSSSNYYEIDSFDESLEIIKSVLNDCITDVSIYIAETDEVFRLNNDTVLCVHKHIQDNLGGDVDNYINVLYDNLLQYLKKYDDKNSIQYSTTDGITINTFVTNAIPNVSNINDVQKVYVIRDIIRFLCYNTKTYPALLFTYINSNENGVLSTISKELCKSKSDIVRVIDNTDMNVFFALSDEFEEITFVYDSEIEQYVQITEKI